MLFMPTVIKTHAQFMHSSCMLMPMNMQELGKNKGVNPNFHVHESYSHVYKPLLRDKKHEHSLFMGMN